jgi:hypothetical protein
MTLLLRVLATSSTRGRGNFVAMHIGAARHFRDQARAIELSHPPSPDSFAPPEYAHCWAAAVLFSALALEAEAYELMTFPDRLKNVDPQQLRFSTEDHRSGILERFDKIHRAVTGEPLKRGEGSVQAAKMLITLRDELAHAKAEWRDDAHVSEQLRARWVRRFKLNPYASGNHFFPDQCMSASCAQWAVSTAELFLRTFASATSATHTV